MSDSEFDPRALLEQLLSTGKQYVEKGQTIAEQKLDIPESGEERDAMLNGLKKGAVASAVLLGLLGTKGGRKLTSSAIKIGGLTALGAAAYKGYQNWKNTGDPMKSEAKPLHELSDAQADDRGLLLIEAMVAAANADGRVDDQEQQAIKHKILELHLPGELAMVLENIIDSPLSAGELAQKVSSEAAAAEVYIATKLLIGEGSSSQEKTYRDSLVAALGMAPELKSALDSQVA